MGTRRISTVLAAALLLAAPLAACGKSDSSSSSDTKAPTDNSTGTTATSNSGSTSCNGLETGKDGIIRVFCDGTATAKVSINSVQSTLTGGTCGESGGYYAINIGAVAGPDYTGAKPNYIGALFPDGGGAVQAVTIRSGGLGGVLTGATGSVSADKQSVHVEGTTLTDHHPASADITCG